MMEPAAMVALTANIALAVLGMAFLLTAWRIIAGPTLPDRVVGLDMLTGIAIGFIAVIAVKTGFALYIDIAISLGLVGFLATVAFARFVLSRGLQHQHPAAPKVKRKDRPKRRGARPGRAG